MFETTSQKWCSPTFFYSRSLGATTPAVQGTSCWDARFQERGTGAQDVWMAQDLGFDIDIWGHLGAHWAHFERQSHI